MCLCNYIVYISTGCIPINIVYYIIVFLQEVSIPSLQLWYWQNGWLSGWLVSKLGYARTRPRVACYACPVLAIVGMSVCLSVTRWHRVKTTQARITKSSPTVSTI